MTIPATRKATIEPTPGRPKTSRQSDIRPRKPIAAAKNAVTSKWGNTQLRLISSLKILMGTHFLVYQLDRRARIASAALDDYDKSSSKFNGMSGWWVSRIQPEPARYRGDGGGRDG
jgi:hypothetical protein